MAENRVSVDKESVILTKGDNSAVIHLFGATLTSWKVKGTELLFVSEQAIFDQKKAIRGGIPFVFPNFGPWKLGPQHGFARTNLWRISKQPEVLPNGDIEVVLTLSDTEETRSIWDHKFTLLYSVVLRENELITDVQVRNDGDKSFSFTLLLHTYLKVPDVTKCLVTGLSNCIYQDKVKGGETFTESRFDVSVNEFTDRVYQNTPSEHLITNCSGGNTIKMIKQNFPDTVLWNPWSENAKKMADFVDNEYPNMICVEPGAVAESVFLNPQEIFQAAQMLQIPDSL